MPNDSFVPSSGVVAVQPGVFAKQTI